MGEGNAIMKLHIAAVIYFSLILNACGKSSHETTDQPLIGTEIQPTTVIESELPIGQLGDSAVPEHYQIELTLNTYADVFSGKEAITVNLKDNTNSIYLHGKDLRVKSVIVTAGARRQQGSYEQLHPGGVSRVSWKEKLKGEVQIEFLYQADYNNSLESIYKVKESGKNYLFSQMESISARMAIPSFDEPGFKTPFDVVVTTKAEDEVITNTPEISAVQLDNGMVRHTFATTKPLPTYLLAFAVGQFDIVDYEALPPTAVRKRAVPLRGITVSGKGEKIKFALSNTRTLLEALENYFGIPYPYAKLDIIAVPDFAFGAMENAGAITYRESLLLLDEKSPLWQKIVYGSAHAHEMSHQWFGDLVTPKWWDDIWLNEAFASWMQNKAGHEWRPEYEYDRAIARNKFAVMDMDARSSARKIRQPINSNDDIMNAFDDISYTKGASVLQMFETMVGKAAFRKGVQLHLRRFAFKASDVNDFEQSLADGSGNKEIFPAFESFLNQSGAPYLDTAVNCDSGRATVEVSQARYVPMGVDINASQQWIIPFCYMTDQGAGCEVIRQKRQSFKLDYCPGFFMPNRNGAGYYRWNVSDEDWRKLMSHMNSMNANEQLELINNLIAAFRADKAPLRTLLDLFRLSTTSDNWDVIIAPLKELNAIRHSLLNDEYTPEFKSLIDRLYASHFKVLGFTPDTAADKRNPTTTARLRQRIVAAMAGEARDPAIRKHLVELINNYLGKDNDSINRDAISPDLVTQAMTVAVEDSDVNFARQLLDKGLNSTDTIFRRNVLFGLAHAKDIAFGKSIIDELLLSDRIRSNEATRLIAWFMENPDYREYTWDWLKNHLDMFVKRYSSFSAEGVVLLGGYFCDEKSRDGMQAYYHSVQDKIPGAPRRIAETMETVNQCIAMKTAYSDDWAELMLAPEH